MTSDSSAQVIAFPANAVRKVHTRYKAGGNCNQQSHGSLTGEAFFSTLRANVERAEKVLERAAEPQNDRTKDREEIDRQQYLDVGYFASFHDALTAKFGSGHDLKVLATAKDTTSNFRNLQMTPALDGEVNSIDSHQTASPNSVETHSAKHAYEIAACNDLNQEPTTSAFKRMGGFLPVTNVVELQEANVTEPKQSLKFGTEPEQSRNVLVATQLERMAARTEVYDTVELDRVIRDNSTDKRSRFDDADLADQLSNEDKEMVSEPSQKPGTLTTFSSPLQIIGNIGPKSPAEQIIDNMRIAAQTPQSGSGLTTHQPEQRVVRFTLQPENLGNVEIRMTMRGNEVKIRIVVESHETNREIVQSQHELQDALVESGFSVEGIEITNLFTRSDRETITMTEIGSDNLLEKNAGQTGAQLNDDGTRQHAAKFNNMRENNNERDFHENDVPEIHSPGRRRMGFYI